MTTTGKVTVGMMLGGIFLVGAARAADQGIAGKKLQMKDPSKVLVLSKDATISVTGSDPANGGDSSITFSDGTITNTVTYALPQTGWSANKAGTRFKYGNDAAPSGPSPIKRVKISDGKLKVSGNALPFAVPNGMEWVLVVLSLDGGTNKYCMAFPGNGDGTKYAAKDGPAQSCTVCGNDVQEGVELCDGTDDWFCPGGCTTDCTCAVCGNGTLEGSEQCDPPHATGACPGSLQCASDCTCEAACPASMDGVYCSGSATGLISSFSISMSGGGGTVTTSQGSGSFSYSYDCPSLTCSGHGALTLSGDIGIASFDALVCIDGANSKNLSGSYSTPAGGGTLSGSCF